MTYMGISQPSADTSTLTWLILQVRLIITSVVTVAIVCVVSLSYTACDGRREAQPTLALCCRVQRTSGALPAGPTGHRSQNSP